MSKTNTSSYEVLRPIAHGGRQEKGAVVQLTADEAANYGADYVKPFVAKAEVVAEVTEKPVEKMTVAELRIKAEEMGLDTTGSKADLVERINLAAEESDGGDE